MAEFFEVPIRREDGSESLHYVNIEAISYIDYAGRSKGEASTEMKVYLNNGYWFTVSGTKAEEILNLIKARGSISFGKPTGDN